MTTDGEEEERGGSARDPSSSMLSSSPLPSPSPSSPTSSSFCFWKTTSPTLLLLSTPWEYFVTIDQSALWQKHIAWAKPKGSDLKAYISSQYSSRMVLLSLLLATEMSVFFNSSPALINLRQHLNIWDNIGGGETETATATQGILPFWIGFFLLLNICVTISGILATFATWNIVSAISDTNAHCLLRSSLGQYVATLSPRLVVTSLYLFLLWFLLFVVELIFGGGDGVDGHNNNGRGGLHELLTKHLHLVLLWACFLVAVTVLFFSIVVPLSAFGRLVLHTGAMAEQPVLSESLQVELLPRGLHAGLVIRAHYSQKRRKAVTKQYQHRNQQKQRNLNQNRESFRLRQTQIQSERLDDIDQNQGGCDLEHPNIVELSSPPIDDFGGQDGTASSMVLTRFRLDTAAPSLGMSVSTGSSGCSNGGDKNDDRDAMVGNTNNINWDPDIFNSDQQHENILPRDHASNRDRKEHRRGTSSHRRHRRMSTTETTASLNLPPATILNLSMTAREFHDVIDSAIDTSSLCPRSPILSTTGPTEGPATGSERSNDPVYPCGGDADRPYINSTEERWRRSNGSSEEGCNWNGEQHNHGCNTSKKQTKKAVPVSCERHSRMVTGKHGDGIPLSLYPTSTPTARAGDEATDTISQPSRRNSSRDHHDLVTRHHRRVSSSRFLLEEWAEENRVRDLYGVASPANLPHEIVWMLENFSQSDNDTRCRQPESITQNEANGTLPHTSPADNSNICIGESMPSASNLSQQHWWLSPFSSPFSARNRIPNNRSSDDSMNPIMLGSRGDNSMVGVMEHNSQSLNREDTLKEPLLPDLTDFRDEELGGGSSELLGESILRSKGEMKQNSSSASNRRNTKESASGIG